MKESYGKGLGAAMLADVLVGEGAADKAAFQLVRVQPCQLPVSGM
jgi:hypothetical protein